ncbi:hypothetical protein ABZU76_44185 [Amycolatopsis sp. NPDC005232]|uniref:hypothetical protein n=1 Tax=Amycolatopsis sp. NPDC005232 TaxID=3157027 RepID=UPI0033ACFA32
MVETTGPDDERLDISPATTTDGAVVWLRLVGRAAAPGSVLNGLFDTETGRLLAQPARLGGCGWTWDRFP